MHLGMEVWSGRPTLVQTEQHKEGIKVELSNFECVMVVHAGWAGLRI